MHRYPATRRRSSAASWLCCAGSEASGWHPALAAMQITKYTHSCVRLEQGGRVLVIDPGIWAEAAAVAGADAVLITHEHSDHLDADRLAGLGVRVFGPAGAD